MTDAELVKRKLTFIESCISELRRLAQPVSNKTKRFFRVPDLKVVNWVDVIEGFTPQVQDYRDLLPASFWALYSKLLQMLKIRVGIGGANDEEYNRQSLESVQPLINRGSLNAH